jgi:hypothetical protein
MRRTVLLTAALILTVVAAMGELADTLAPSVNHPAIGYFDYGKHPGHDAVSALNHKIGQGAVQLHFEKGSGYLRAVLEALDVPVESQVVVFSKTSLQADRIEPDNPRTIFFNDSLAVAWVRGGFIELAAQDPEQGVIFHTLEQRAAQKPEFLRRDQDCLRCHISDTSLGVPGMMVRSRYPGPDGMPRLILGGYATDHRSPLEERWGGWYVTGTIGAGKHMGNTVFAGDDQPQTIPATFETSGYLSPRSDIAALLVFNHQMHMMNLLTRFGWDTRVAIHDKRLNRAAMLQQSARELVDYLLFIDEARLPGGIASASGFARRFEASGPRDSQGRSFRELDLKTRLLRYPCSYMIYSEAFDSLPAEARNAIYSRMWQVLSGEEKGARYSRLSAQDRGAIVEILRDTKRGLPGYFQPVAR